MKRTLAATCAALVVGVVTFVLLISVFGAPAHHVEAAPSGGPYEDIVPAFRPAAPDEFFFEVWNGWSFAVTGYITVHTGISVGGASFVGAIPIALPALSTTTIPIADVPGVPIGHAGFAQVWTERIVNSSAYSTQGRYHIVTLGEMTFGAPPVAAAGRAHARHSPAGDALYEITVQPGDTVSWVSSRYQGFNHNVVADDGSFTSGAPNTEWRIFSHVFTTPGDYPFYCVTHGGPGGVGMAGIVHVEGETPAPLENPVYLPMVNPVPQ